MFLGAPDNDPVQFLGAEIIFQGVQRRQTVSIITISCLGYSGSSILFSWVTRLVLGYPNNNNHRP